MRETQQYTIPYKELKNGCHEYRFEVDGSLFEEYQSAEIKDGRCEVTVAADGSDNRAVLDVTINGHVVVECDRCLEDCRVPVEFEGQLLVKYSEEVHEYDGEVIWMLPGEEQVDLKQYVYESIVLSLPYQRVHPEGECNPEMLERFRIVSPEEFATVESRAGGSTEHNEGEWAKLAALRERMEAEQTAESDEPGGAESGASAAGAGDPVEIAGMTEAGGGAAEGRADESDEGDTEQKKV